MKKIVLLTLPLLLIACERNDVAKTFGMNRQSPDEFMVVQKPPLSVPPSFSLRPPEEAQQIIRDTSNESAKSTVFSKSSAAGKVKISNTNVGKAENKLLEKAGASNSDDSIRKVLSEDVSNETVIIKEEKGILADYFPSLWKKDEPVVDPEKERERLQKNDIENKSVLDGETPTTKPAKGQ